MQPRARLRQHFRQCRRELTAHQQQHAAAQVCAHLIQSCQPTKQHHIAVYLANDGEVSLAPFIEHCWQSDIAVYLPVLHPFYKKTLLFTRYRPSTTMVANKFAIAEPQLNCTDVCPVNQLTHVLTPLVAFDKQGRRLGMGGGFYDRTFSAVQQGHLSLSLIGIAHQCQQADHLSTAAWDVDLHKIITDKAIFLQ